jgi:hypothetical protein
MPEAGGGEWTSASAGWGTPATTGTRDTSKKKEDRNTANRIMAEKMTSATAGMPGK